MSRDKYGISYQLSPASFSSRVIFMNDLSLQLGSAAIVNPHFSCFSTIYKGGKISAIKRNYILLHLFLQFLWLISGKQQQFACSRLQRELSEHGQQVGHQDSHRSPWRSFHFFGQLLFFIDYSTRILFYHFGVKKQLIAVGNLEMHIFCRRFKMSPKLLRGLMWLYCHMRIITSWSYD